MRIIARICLFLILTVSLLSVSSVEGEMSVNNMNLVIKTDKANYFIGDEIKITYSFLNNGSYPVYVLPWGGEYITNWIIAYNSAGEKLVSLLLVIYDKKIIPSREDFILINPKEAYDITIEGKIILTKLSRFGDRDRKKYKGVFIDFDNSAIFLEKTGTFIIKAFYRGEKAWKEKGKELYNLNNIWVGNMESNEIKITVQKFKSKTVSR